MRSRAFVLVVPEVSRVRQGNCLFAVCTPLAAGERTRAGDMDVDGDFDQIAHGDAGFMAAGAVRR